jgi:spore germination protein KC
MNQTPNLISKAALLVGCLGMLPGCWDRNEINDLALVMGRGLDLAENGEVESTLQIALPAGIAKAKQGGARAQRATLVVSQTGKDGVDNMSRLEEQLSRRVFLGYRGITVIGEQYARHGIDQVLDEFTRAPFSHYSNFILTAHGASAKEVLLAKYALERVPTLGMRKLEMQNNGVAVKISDFMDDISQIGIAPVTGAIRLVKDDRGKTTFIIDEAAVYKSSKLVGYLSEPEVRMLQCWKGRCERIKITAQAQPMEEGYKGTIGYDIHKASVQVNTSVHNGKPEVSVKFKAYGVVSENDTKLDLSKNMGLVDRMMTDEVHRMVSKLVHHVQKELNSDILGIGRKLHTQHPSLWKQLENDWENIFPDIPIAIEVDVKVDRIGRTQLPAQFLQKEIPPAQ